MARLIRIARTLMMLMVACALLFPAVPAYAITRQEVVARGKVWVDRKVPYSQSRFASVEGTRLPVSTSTYTPSRYGYRTDCSGFVSMCLNLRTTKGLPYSMSTATLDNVMYKIPKSALKPGDVILRPNDLVINGSRVSYGHAVLFVGWTDSAKTRYVGYHESSSGKGAVRSIIDWGTSGFWGAAGFAPYRCGAVRDRSRITTATAQ